ncbi:hypothetical protein L2E82_34771 [Cichorium intybus]|uniref:Uncharacterized protein n=1 Tax=Cichorium intybus TaxID=13427 RepID=A0ACB9BN06_CICIN|nr:hypothetical protein L2E82_34771 [Cichorium intybus]
MQGIGSFRSIGDYQNTRSIEIGDVHEQLKTDRMLDNLRWIGMSNKELEAVRMLDNNFFFLSVQQKLRSCRCNKDRLTGMLKFGFSSSDDDDGAISMVDFGNSKLFLGASTQPAT